MKKICRNRNFENVNKCMFTGIGKYNIPVIRKQEYESCDFIGFNYAARCQDRINTGIHFFLDDYQFQRLWVMPDYYIPMLKQFKCVMTPDYSIYALVLEPVMGQYPVEWQYPELLNNGMHLPRLTKAN